MKKALSLIATAVLACSMTACSSSDSPKGSGEKAEPGTGKLVIYSPNSDTEIENELAAFQEKYPDIQVDLQSMGTGDCVARIEAESENPQADVMWGGMNYGVYKQNPDLWEKYVSKNDENVDENYRNDTGYFSNYVLSGSGAFIKNDKLLKELGVEVNSYEDLLQPELKGKIAMGDPTSSSSAWAELTNMLLVKGGYDSEEAWDYVQKFIDNLDGKIISSSSQVYKGVIDGEYAVGVSYEDPVVQAIIDNKDNPNVEISMCYPKEGAVWLPAAAAMVKDAPNKENAQLFLDFLQSKDCQEIISRLTVRPADTSLKQENEAMKPFSDINVAYEDIEYCADHKDEWQNRWTEMMTN
ncbi:extracellular solute-binding protein [Faecalibaculum rodentium]|uniref:Iron(III)-binding protein n=1 Tax=Faecalibaculum rodentium TaxID=1702221 RepID=A0A1Q9YJW8_9FIRM|nr:extracellular solute-binding protein [Faecalibaculum rodentium]OLU44808.1 iron(III)-binding protein [Faecalibaculum rodentium]